MTRSIVHGTVALLFSAAVTLITPAAMSAEKPNIVFILADDIGYGDLSCYGARLVQTPRLDQLAQQGRKFTDAHSAASTCTPSRRALLTGTYSWRQRPGSAIMRGDAPLSITTDTYTLPRMLKEAGYATGLVGKWHLGLGPAGGPNWNGEITPGPPDLGFDYSYFYPATGDRVPCVFIENRHVVGLDPADPIQVNYDHKIGSEPTGRENPDQLILKAVEGHDNTIVNGIGRIGWMSGGKSARWKDEEMADTITSHAVSFIKQHSAQPFFLYVATHNIHVPRVPHPRFRGKSQAGVRGDAVVELDASVGSILDCLDELKITGKTLVIFTSDNGGVAGDGYADNVVMEHKMNGDLRGHKSTLWEGGHRIPFIARWPGQIPAGTQCDELITQVDMLRSFASLLTRTLPGSAAPDSLDVLAALLGKSHNTPGRTTFITHNGGVQGPLAVRQDNWKIVQPGSGKRPAAASGPSSANDDRTTGVQLFDLASDLREEHDLAAERPELAQRLLELLKTERARVQPAAVQAPLK
jgi:arylsulfatase A-like enzyme